MQVICNIKGGVRLARVLDQRNKGAVLCPHLQLKEGMNTVDDEHFSACCDAANKAWLGALFDPGVMLRNGKPALEMPDDDAPVKRHRRSAKDAIELARSADAEGLELLELDEADEDQGEPRSTVVDAIERRRRHLEEAADE